MYNGLYGEASREMGTFVGYGCRKVAKFDKKYFHSINDIFSFDKRHIFIR